MELLENAAKEQGYRYLILESDEPLVAAMALYRKFGYEIRFTEKDWKLFRNCGLSENRNEFLGVYVYGMEFSII